MNLNRLVLSVLVYTSNWIRRLFFNGTANGGIEKCEAYFFKVEKAAAFQLRSRRLWRQSDEL